MAIKHSEYGASTASRWLNCPGSIRLISQLPAKLEEEVNPYAKEGTTAHELAEACLKLGKHPVDVATEELDPTGEMVEAVGVYYDYIQKKLKNRSRATLAIEKKFDLSHIAPGMFGTNDACIYDSVLDSLEVIDYKHGAGVPVSPVENAQLAYYGIGAANTYKLNPKSAITLTIVQPRAQGEAIKSWETTYEYLQNFTEVLRKGVEKCKDKDAPLAEGSWCKFCPALAVCPQVKKTALEIAKAEFDDEVNLVLPEPEKLEIVDIQKALSYAPIISSWFKAVEAHAFNLASSGVKIEGYKLVKKRAVRKWKYEEDEILRILSTQYSNSERDRRQWVTEPKLKSPAQLEKIIDKDFIENLCETPDNGNTLVPIQDRRPEVLVQIGQDFDIVEG